MKYDYKRAADHIAELRRKVIEQKDGNAVEGLTPLPQLKEGKKRPSAAKTQEME